MKTPIKKKAKKGDRVRVSDRASTDRTTPTPETPSNDVTVTPVGQTGSNTTTVTKLTMSLEGGIAEKVMNHINIY